MCHRRATRVIGCSLNKPDVQNPRQVSGPRDPAAAADRTGRSHLRADDAADPQGRRTAGRERRRLDHRPSCALDAHTLGVVRHDSNGAALRHPLRSGAAVRGPRVRGPAGMRHQPVSCVPPDCPARRPVQRRDGLRDHRGSAGRQPDLPRNHVQRDRLMGRQRHQAARFLPGLPQSRHLRPRRAAWRRRLARRVSRRRHAARPDHGLLRGPWTAGHRPGQAESGAGARQGHAPHDVSQPARRLRRQLV